MQKKIIFNFDDNLPFQQDAMNAIVNLFQGQDKELGDVIYRGVKKPAPNVFLEDPGRNRLDLGETDIIRNLRRVQQDNMLFPVAELDSGYNFSVEMETGTGKTYVYLRTILELYNSYNFLKFIIVVPTVAIRKGIEKSIDMLKEHFKTIYDIDISQHASVYDSKKTGQMQVFTADRDLQIVIMNIQAFNRETNKIRTEDERGQVLWDLIKHVKPIVIIDEPQRLEGSGKKKTSSLKAIEELQPLFILRYSATHKKLYNQVYRLDSYQAYKQDLVKKIEVKTVFGSINRDYPYIRYMNFTKDYKAKIEIFYSEPGGVIRQKPFDVAKGISLQEISGNLPQYKNMIIMEDPHKKNGLKIGTGGSSFLLHEGENNYESDAIDLIRIQIWLTIQKHFEKQLKILEKGYKIKVVSLFFIDAVKNFRDSESPDGRGLYARIFDEEYAKIILDDHYNKVFELYPDLFTEYKDIQKVREGYFARDKKNNETEIDDWDWSKDDADVKAKSQEDIERGIQLILDKKDELISFEEPLAFIFSHSALREGWDNPNVFQLCTLKHGSSEIAKRQEIGRGLRLSVDIEGNRCFDNDINVLTVVANDYYDHFAQALQKDYMDESGFNREEVSYEMLKSTLEKAGLPKELITPVTIEKLRTELAEAGMIDPKNNCLTKKVADILYYEFTDPNLKNHQQNIREKFIEVMKDKGSKKIEIINGDEPPIENAYHSFISEKEFEQLWHKLREAIVQRTMYQVKIDNEEFIRECILEINAELKHRVIMRDFEVATGKADFDAAKRLQFDDPTKIIISLGKEKIDISKSDFEIVNYLMSHTMLPRKAIFRIIDRMDEKLLLQKQAVLDEVMKIIKTKLIEFSVKGIDYEPIDGYLFEEKTIFEVEDINREMLDKKRAYKTNEGAKKTLHKYIRADSDGEFAFARSLDEDPDVLLFSKLKKGGLVIDTPYGNYSPDWAIIHKVDEQTAKLYFIIESKFDKKQENLTPVEAGKLKCAREHFAKISADITFDWVNNYQRFKILVSKENEKRKVQQYKAMLKHDAP